MSSFCGENSSVSFIQHSVSQIIFFREIAWTFFSKASETQIDSNEAFAPVASLKFIYKFAIRIQGRGKEWYYSSHSVKIT